MTEVQLYDVKVRKDRNAVYNPSMPPNWRQFKDIREDQEAVAILLRGEELEVTVVHRQSDEEHGTYPGYPVTGLFATIRLHTWEPGDEDYVEDGNNRAAQVTWGSSGFYPGDVFAPEAAAFQAVLTKAMHLVSLADFALQVRWFEYHLAQKDAEAAR